MNKTMTPTKDEPKAPLVDVQDVEAGVSMNLLMMGL